MNFTQLIDRLSLSLQNQLPGMLAHEPMRAVAIGDVRPDFTHKMPPKRGSVLILLYEENSVIKFPLTKRAEYPGAHGGQVSLPGGKAEGDEAPYQTALRESEEEIGIKRERIKVIGRLTDFFVMPSNFMVTPVIGYMEEAPVFIRDPREVARIISGTIDELVSEHAVLKKEIIAAGKYKMMAPHFEIEKEVVWGATAMMLNEFRMVLRDIYSRHT